MLLNKNKTQVYKTGKNTSNILPRKFQPLEFESEKKITNSKKNLNNFVQKTTDKLFKDIDDVIINKLKDKRWGQQIRSFLINWVKEECS